MIKFGSLYIQRIGDAIAITSDGNLSISEFLRGLEIAKGQLEAQQEDLKKKDVKSEINSSLDLSIKRPLFRN